jgi:Zn-dependent metalloprotease
MAARSFLLAAMLVAADVHAAPPGAEDIARSYLAGRRDLTHGDDLRLERVSRSGAPASPLGRPAGGLVSLVRHHRGVPIVGGTVQVRLGPGGEVLRSSADRGVVPRWLSVDPAMPAGDAVRLASDGALDEPRAARLVVWAMPLRRARLAWVVDLPFDWEERAQWRVVIDAQEGSILMRENRVSSARGKAFPGGSPAAGELEIVELDVTPGSTTLRNADFVTLNCIDRNTCPLRSGTTRIHFCETEPKAMADANGDFLYDRPASDGEPEDEFSEVQMFYHTSRTMQMFRSLGLEALRSPPMNVYMNVRGVDPFQPSNANCTAHSPLAPFDNAFYTPAGGFWPTGPSLVFGQAAAIDFAYDGDVVAHELGHAVQDVLHPDTAIVYTDEYGLNRDAHGMKEATADFFAAAVTDDPLLGEYALAHYGENRDLRNFTRCPDNIVGEEHFDGEMFRSGMWSGRTALPEAQWRLFDQALYNAMDGFGSTQSFAEAASATLAEVRLLAGDAAAAAVSEAFERHGLDGCSDRVADVDPGAQWWSLYITGTFGGAPRMPATVQWRVNLDRPYDRLILSMVNFVPAGFPMGAVTKIGGDPIRWDPETLTHDGRENSILTTAPFSSVVPGPFPAGPVVVQLVAYGPSSNVGSASAIAAGPRITPQNDAPRPDAGMMTGGGAEEGGGCAVGGGSGGWLAVLALLALRRRRR